MLNKISISVSLSSSFVRLFVAPDLLGNGLLLQNVGESDPGLNIMQKSGAVVKIIAVSLIVKENCRRKQ